MSDASLILSIGSGLRKEVGWRWPLLAIRGVAGGRALFNRSHWVTPAAPADEAKYLKRLSPLAGLYSQLVQLKGPEQALRVMRQVTGSIPLLPNELVKVDLSGPITGWPSWSLAQLMQLPLGRPPASTFRRHGSFSPLR